MQIKIAEHADGRLITSRAAAQQLRADVELALSQQREVVFDFSGVLAAQPFIDELVGVLVLRHGPDILNRLIFKSCSNDTRAAIEFVAADRSNQFAQSM